MGEKNGVGVVMVCEHHGNDDGYCPSPLTALSAMVTSVIILPFHDPLRLAEDIAVLDIDTNSVFAIDRI